MPIALVLLAGCSTTEEVVPDGWVDPACGGAAWIELTALDIWGRDLSTSAEQELHELVPNEPRSWRVDAPGFLGAEVIATWSGSLDGAAVTAVVSGTARYAISLDVRDVSGLQCPVYGLFVGLDHPWFAASGRPPSAGNDVDFLMDGEEMWGAVYADLTADRPAVRVHQSTWWWESDHELVRTTDSLSAEERRSRTMMGLMEARGGEHRVLVARFAAETAPGLAYQNNDEALRAHATNPDDKIQAIIQANPTLVELPGEYNVPARDFSFVARVLANPSHGGRTFYATATVEAPLVAVEAASMHQKAMVIDHDIAYVSGMNVKNQDWDSSEYRLYDGRRMHYSATDEERARAESREELPDWEARKDYGVRIQGPGARIVDEILQQRWDYSRATGELYAEHTTPYELLPAAEAAGDTTVQVVVTSPEPLQERSILETHDKASRLATDLIVIEDQYWRAPVISDALVDAMDRNPGLHLIVITQDIADGNGAKKYSYLTDDTFRSRYPDRYLLLQLKTFGRSATSEPIFETIFLHSKLHLVDDTYLSVGSCNKNNRGYLYEGEMNVAVADPAWVAAAKARVLTALVGDTVAPDVVGKTGAEVFATVTQVAASNAEAEATLGIDPTADVAPSGIIYPLIFSSKYVLDVGPDLF